MPKHHLPQAHHRPSPRAGEHHIRVSPAAVHRVEVYHPQGVPVVLLADHIPVHREDAHIPVSKGLPVYIGHRAVREIGLHGVPLETHGKHRPPGHLLRHRDHVVVLAKHRGSVAGSGRGAVEGDLRHRLRRRNQPLHILLIAAQGLQHRVHRLPAGHIQLPVPL